jgi:chromosome segregation ATPase
MQRELQALRAELCESRQSGDQQLEADRSLLQGDVARVRAELEACLATKAEVQELSGKLESTRAHGQQVESSGVFAVAKVAAQVHKLEERVDQECSRLSAEALQAGDRVLDTVRGDETLRLNKLEQSMPEAFNACFAAEERVKQDLQSLREELKAAEALTSCRLDSTNGAITSQMEPVQGAVDVLTREIHSFIQLQTEQHEEQTKVLELVKAMEGRLWPGRKSVLGSVATNQSTSPQGSTAREHTLKAASRPASARGQRPDGNAAGAALGAARVARAAVGPSPRSVAIR